VSPFGRLTPAQWGHLAIHVARRDEEGRWRFRYDPGIAVPFKAAAPYSDVDLRPLWNAVRGPVLVLHGEQSDLLTADIYREMLARPGTEGIVVPDTGHAPALMDASLVAAVRSFLLA
jgi:pimeloyl-ACP methyl ester carboxylesterase